MSEFIEKLKSRRSVRSFKSEMPPKEVIDEIISAGLYAPSGMNRQPVMPLQTKKCVKVFQE